MRFAVSDLLFFIEKGNAQDLIHVFYRKKVDLLPKV
jgi:hypothetical protein